MQLIKMKLSFFIYPIFNRLGTRSSVGLMKLFLWNKLDSNLANPGFLSMLFLHHPLLNIPILFLLSPFNCPIMFLLLSPFNFTMFYRNPLLISLLYFTVIPSDISRYYVYTVSPSPLMFLLWFFRHLLLYFYSHILLNVPIMFLPALLSHTHGIQTINF